MRHSMELFLEVTAGLPRQGPGSTAATLQALSMVAGLPRPPRILDVGCGPGAQTIDLARATGGSIVAMDLHQPFLHELAARAKEAGVTSHISPIRMSMFAMSFASQSFDLIWSEGAIYIRGFEAGLDDWRRFLKPGGWLVVSELSWLVAEAPEQARSFWAANYPAMRSREANGKLIQALGYVDLQTFVLPAQDWWDNYYGPGERRLQQARARYEGDPEACAMLDEIGREYDVFRACSDSYGYVFYVMRNPAAACAIS